MRREPRASPRRWRFAWLISVAMIVLGLQVRANAVLMCDGEPVTIKWTDAVGSLITGTDHADVIQGGDTSETILGEGGDDHICGGGGSDKIDGGGGADRLFGQDGEDFFIGDGIALDSVFGGSGGDQISLRNAPGEVDVDLVTHVIKIGGFDGGGRVSEVDDVVGSAFDDKIRGNGRDNDISGGKGDDVISPGGGEDELDGGRGVDEVTFAESKQPISIRYGESTFVDYSDASKNCQLDDHFEVITGTDFNDRLTGTDLADDLHGGKGRDVIKGLGGNDLLFGDEGSDIIYPGPGDDTVEGGSNGPVTSLDDAGDVVNYKKAVLEDSDGCVNPKPCDGLEVELTPFGDKDYGEATGEGDDILRGIESIRGMGGIARGRVNFLGGDEGPNVIAGNDSRDYIEGMGGNDLLYGVGSADVIEGGDGDDYLNSGRDDADDSGDMLDGGGSYVGDTSTNDTCDGGAFSVINCEHGTAKPNH